MMNYYLFVLVPRHAITVILCIVLLMIPSSLSTSPKKPPQVTFHNGPILTGNVNLAIIWYGNVEPIQKDVIRDFIKSLNMKKGGPQPAVATWWKKVQSYQAPKGGKAKSIKVSISKEISDPGCKQGKVMTIDFISKLTGDAAGGPNMIPVIFGSNDVTVHGLCAGRCGMNGLDKANKPYIIVVDPEKECPGACAWPFFKSDTGPAGPIFAPPSGNMAADAMVIAFAGSLAEVVTNPTGTGWWGGRERDQEGIAKSCHRIFGTGASEGNAGKVLMDGKAAFNAHGFNGRKFLLPSIFDPKSSACWTLT